MNVECYVFASIRILRQGPSNGETKQFIGEISYQRKCSTLTSWYTACYLRIALQWY